MLKGLTCRARYPGVSLSTFNWMWRREDVGIFHERGMKLSRGVCQTRMIRHTYGIGIKPFTYMNTEYKLVGLYPTSDEVYTSPPRPFFLFLFFLVSYVCTVYVNHEIKAGTWDKTSRYFVRCIPILRRPKATQNCLFHSTKASNLSLRLTNHQK